MTWKINAAYFKGFSKHRKCFFFLFGLSFFGFSMDNRRDCIRNMKTVCIFNFFPVCTWFNFTVQINVVVVVVETCWRDRHNLVASQNSYFDRSAIIHRSDPNAKLIVRKLLASYLQKPIDGSTGIKDICLLLTESKSWKGFREENGWTVHIHNN